MDKLRNYIKRHYEDFNDEEPDKGHLERFDEKLQDLERENKTRFLVPGMVMRIAAVILVLLAISTVYFRISWKNIGNLMTSKMAVEMPQEIQHAIKYYNVLSNNQYDKIEEYAGSEEESARVKQMAESELAMLESNTERLKQEYMNNLNNERVKAALIKNQQKKKELMDKIINQLEQKQTNNPDKIN